MFVPNDEESYFINPANEPVLNKLFASVFENAENGRVLADRIRADAAAKSEPHNYRIRI